MADKNQPTPRQTLVVLLGASAYDYAPRLAQGPAFYNSSQQFGQYLKEKMGIPEENVRSFFDETRPAADQLRDIRAFLERRAGELKNVGPPARDLIVHYVGHGLFSGGDNDYCLAIRSTEEQNEGFTSIRMKDLAGVIRKSAGFLRKYLILDCCFSGAAFAQFLSGPLDVVQVKMREVLDDDSPERGTSLLCSASARNPSVAPRGLARTMFSDSLLTVLTEGHKAFGPWLSLRDLGELVRHQIKETYGEAGVRPELHTPEEEFGDVARVPLFPNPAHSHAFDKQVDAERVRAQEERERAEAERRRIEAEEEERKRQADAAQRAQKEQAQKARELAKALEEKRRKQRKMVGVTIVAALASLAIYLSYSPTPPIQAPTTPPIQVPPQGQPPYRGTTKGLHSIFGTQDGWHLWAVGDKGTILQSDDAGVKWRDRTSGTARKQHSIFGTQDLKHLWTVGDKGTILQSDDGGITWQTRTSGTKNELHSVFGTQEGGHLWTVGDHGTILQSDDDGATWQAQFDPTNDNLNSIFGTTHGEHLWAVGDQGTILKSDDLGATWQVRASGTTKKLQSIFGTQDLRHLWAVGENGTILQSDDDGNTWQARMSGTGEALNSVLGTPDGSRLWAVGDKTTILESDDGGATWRMGDKTTILESDDGGASWRMGTIWNGSDLLSIFATQDGKRLYAVGESGTVLRFPGLKQ